MVKPKTLYTSFVPIIYRIAKTNVAALKYLTPPLKRPILKMYAIKPYNWSRRTLIKNSELGQLKMNGIKPSNWSRRPLIQNSELLQLKINAIKPCNWSRRPLICDSEHLQLKINAIKL